MLLITKIVIVILSPWYSSQHFEIYKLSSFQCLFSIRAFFIIIIQTHCHCIIVRDLIYVIPEWSSGFPFFNLSLNLAIRSSWSEPQSAPGLVFADYRASPSLAAKNIVNLISILTVSWCPCVEYSLVLLEEGVFYDQCIFLAKLLLVFAVLHSVFQGQICLLLQVSLEFLLLHSSPLWWKGHLFLVLVLEGLIDLHRTVQLHFFSTSDWV